MTLFRESLSTKIHHTLRCTTTRKQHRKPALEEKYEAHNAVHPQKIVILHPICPYGGSKPYV